MSDINEVREGLGRDAAGILESDMAAARVAIDAAKGGAAMTGSIDLEQPRKGLDWARPTRRREAAVELLLAQGYKWQDGVWVAPLPTPAVDLEQFRMLARGSIGALTQNKVYPADVSAAISSMRHLLALIDGLSNVRSSSEHSSKVAADLVTDDAVRRLVRAMENTPGDELIEPNTRLCRRLLAAALQPTKGEGVAGG